MKLFKCFCYLSLTFLGLISFPCLSQAGHLNDASDDDIT
jgi:hypothetical protein